MFTSLLLSAFLVPSPHLTPAATLPQIALSSKNDIISHHSSSSSNSNEVDLGVSALDPNIASQFKIVTCSSTSCTKKSQALGLDEYALFSGLFQRKEMSNVPQVEVEETGCLGCCQVGPCVGIEHEDFYGTVALEGMKPNEFSDRVFQK